MKNVKNLIIITLVIPGLLILLINPGFAQSTPINSFHVDGGDKVQSILFSPDKTMIMIGARDAILFDLETGAELFQETHPFGGCVYSLAFSDGGKRIAAGGSHLAVKIWSLESGDEIYTFHQDMDYSGPTSYTSLIFHPDNERIFASVGGSKIAVFDYITKQMDQFSDIGGSSRSMYITPDETRLISHAIIFSLTTGEILYDFNSGVIHLTPDGTQLFHTNTGIITYYDTNTMEKVKESPLYSRGNVEALLSPDGMYNIIGKGDSETLPTALYENASGNEIQTFIPEGNEDTPLDRAAFSDDGKLLALAFGDTVYVYDISDLTSIAKSGEELN